MLLGHKDLALADMVGRTDDALILHLLHQSRSLVIADRQFALDVRGRTLAVLDDDGDRLIIKRVFAIGIAAQPEHQINV